MELLRGDAFKLLHPPPPPETESMWGVAEIRGYLIGVLIIRSILLFEVHIRVPPIFIHPNLVVVRHQAS